MLARVQTYYGGTHFEDAIVEVDKEQWDEAKGNHSSVRITLTADATCSHMGCRKHLKGVNLNVAYHEVYETAQK